MRQVEIVFLSLVLAVVVIAMGGVDWAFADPSGASGATLTLRSTPRVDENGNPVTGQLVLAATLTTADGKPVSDRSISFYEQVHFLGGEREAFLGTATTDSTGVAGIVYQPANQGSDVIVARFGGDAGYASAEARATLDVTEVVPPFKTESVPLATVGGWLAIAFGVLVVAAWAVLLGVFLKTTLGIKAAGSSTLRAARGAVLAEVPVKSRQ